MCIQPILTVRRRLILKCETLKNIGDVGPYGSVLELLNELCEMIRPKKVVKTKKKVAQALRDTLRGLYSVYEEHAKKGFQGLASIMHAALTGIDCIESVKRARASCLAQQKTEEKPQQAPRKFNSGSGRGSRGSYGRGGHRRLPERNFERDASNVRCHNCFELGHFQADCKKARAKKV